MNLEDPRKDDPGRNRAREESTSLTASETAFVTAMSLTNEQRERLEQSRRSAAQRRDNLSFQLDDARTALAAAESRVRRRMH